MIERLELTQKRYEEIEEELMKEEVISDIKRMMKLNKEKADLEEIVNKYNEYKKIESDIEAAHEMLKEKEMEEFAREELESLEQQKATLVENIEKLLMPKDPNDSKNVVVEIRGAAGGDEANIFAGDLFKMYTKYAESEGYKIEIIEETIGSAGGFSQIEFMVKGNGAYSKLKYESGSHRVQRVPATETQGRVHTSTATVLAMPEAEEFDIEISEADIKVEVCRSSGAGGQSVNTTDSAVRMTHIPTGIMVYSQTERSQIKNREKAIKLLKTRVYEYYLHEEEQKAGNERKNKIGTGDRSEKIRTYNYPQNRITDHRINFTSMNLDRVMDGKLSEIIEALINEDQKRKLEGK